MTNEEIQPGDIQLEPSAANAATDEEPVPEILRRAQREFSQIKQAFLTNTEQDPPPQPIWNLPQVDERATQSQPTFNAPNQNS